jgi:hypothetical protein
MCGCCNQLANCRANKANIDWDTLGFGLKDVASVRLLPTHAITGTDVYQHGFHTHIADYVCLQLDGRARVGQGLPNAVRPTQHPA